jgi:hypothetical protein
LGLVTGVVGTASSAIVGVLPGGRFDPYRTARRLPQAC